MTPVEAPDLQPLRRSHEANAVEADLKRLVIDLFEANFRARERDLNVHGMAHRGSFELVERFVTSDGLALFRRDDPEAMRYLFRAWRARNPKRGLHFLRTYLQLLWPNSWALYQLWQPKAQPYGTGLVTREAISDPDPHTNYFLTSRVRVVITNDDDTEASLTLARVAPALRSVLAARFLMKLEVVMRPFENVGQTGYQFINGSGTISVILGEGSFTT